MTRPASHPHPTSYSLAQRAPSSSSTTFPTPLRDYRLQSTPQTTRPLDIDDYASMTTPSSSVTTPSPPMAYLQANPLGASTAVAGPSIDAEEREQRQRAVQKFMARAEISKLSRGLRARLSYATYKATHNVSQLPLSDLEAHAQTESSSSARAIAGKSTYYDGTPSQGGSMMSPPAAGLQRRGSMAPPTAIPSTSRAHHAQPNGKEGPSAHAAQSLYASILAPPPAKRARTIHNPDDPHVPAPPKMTNGTPKARRGSHPTQPSRTAHGRTGSGTQIFSSIAEHTRAQSRRKPEPSKGKSSKRDKGKSRRHADGTGAFKPGDAHDVDIDMKAAATLTHLLRNSRSSITVGTASPRSSISAGSDVGSAQSLSQFAQSSTRTTTAPSSLVPSVESSFMAPAARPKTPPLGRRGDGNTTPKMGHPPAPGGGTAPASATDQEAVNLLYYLHESPSPARPTTTRGADAHDAAAFRALGGGAELQAKGRVLFPAGGTPDGALAQRMLARDNSGSFASTATALSDSPTRRGSLASLGSQGQGQSFSKPEAPPPKVTLTSSEPRAEPLPLPVSPSPRPAQAQAPRQAAQQPAAPTTPGTFTFNLNEFINVSPSPAAGGGALLKPGLRADVGRKLFEEEAGEPRGGQEGANGALGAGIHLAHF